MGEIGIKQQEATIIWSFFIMSLAALPGFEPTIEEQIPLCRLFVCSIKVCPKTRQN